jgi:hypothetical protein
VVGDLDGPSVGVGDLGGVALGVVEEVADQPHEPGTVPLRHRASSDFGGGGHAVARVAARETSGHDVCHLFQSKALGRRSFELASSRRSATRSCSRVASRTVFSPA